MTTTGSSASVLSTYPVSTITSYTIMGSMPTPLSFPDKCRSSLYDMQNNGIGVSWTYYTQGCALTECCPSGNAYTTPYRMYPSDSSLTYYTAIEVITHDVGAEKPM